LLDIIIHAIITCVKILDVRVCLTEVGHSGGRTRLVTHDLHTHCTLYCVCMITSGHNWEAAYSKWSRRIWEQQLKEVQLRSSSWSRHNRGAAADVVKEHSQLRPLKQT